MRAYQNKIYSCVEKPLNNKRRESVMTWASYEFKTVVRKRLLKEFSWKEKAILTVITVLWLVSCLLFFFVPYFGAKVIACICAALGIFIFIYILKTYKAEPYDYVKRIRGGVKNVQSDMSDRNLPLSLVGDDIKADIEQEMERIETIKAHRFDLFRKFTYTLVVIPVAYPLALMCQALFNNVDLSVYTNMNAAVSLVTLIFVFMSYICMFAYLLHIFVEKLMDYIYEEKYLRLCLDVFKEIEMSEKAQSGYGVNGIDSTNHNE